MPAPHVGDAVDVHVDTDALGTAPGSGQAEVGHLGPDAGEGGEALYGWGDVAVELVAEDDGCLLEVSVVDSS